MKLTTFIAIVLISVLLGLFGGVYLTIVYRLDSMRLSVAAEVRRGELHPEVTNFTASAYTLTDQLQPSVSPQGLVAETLAVH